MLINSISPLRAMVHLGRAASNSIAALIISVVGGFGALAQAEVYQAEDYHQYHDTTWGNSGDAYRKDNVDIQVTSDEGGGYNVGWIAKGEWLVFEGVTIPHAGKYRVSARMASPNGGALKVDLNAGSQVLAELNVGATGGWQNWATVSAEVHIEAGTYSLGVYALSSGFNLNWVEIEAVAPEPEPEIGLRLQAEDYTDAYDLSPGNAGGVYRSDSVDIEPTTDVDGGFNVGWWDAGEWLAFQNVSIAESGQYRISARIASEQAGGVLRVDVDHGATVLGQIDVPDTGGWQQWQTLYFDTPLTAGVHRLGLYAAAGGFNLNWVEIVKLDEEVPPGPGKLVWQDGFDEIDPAVWNFATGDNVYNYELQWYNGSQNASVVYDPIAGSNVLVLEAKKEQGGPCWHGGNCAYTSAKLETNGKKSFQYGRIEARMRLPRIQGIWPAFWMLGDKFNTEGWPKGGEIDIMEHVDDNNVTSGALHGPGYSGNTPITGALEQDGNIDERYAVYAIEWDENGIRWFVDGENFYSATRADVEQYGEWVYDQPFWLILNVAVGGTWPGDPDPETFTTQRLYVDYVRVYNLDNPGCENGATGPFGGSPAAVPGKIEAEHYDLGCPGQSYIDTDPENLGQAYRDDGVDVEASTDAGGGYNVGWIRDGERLNYTVQVAANDNYDFHFRVASDGNGSSFLIKMDGQSVASVQTPNTGGWQSWQTVTVSRVPLAAGTHTLSIDIEDGDFNLNYFSVSTASACVNEKLCVDKSRGEWTLLVVPDTQHYSQNRANAPIAYMQQAFDWIVSSRDDLNIRFVQGLGDITEGWNKAWEWDNASSAWDKLYGKVPFMPIQGNHDDPWMLNKYFPVSSFSAESWWGGDFGGIENNYALMTIGKEDYLFLQVEAYDQYSPYRPEGLEWAKGILAAYPNRKVILATHDLWATKTIRENLLTRFDNIILANAGHDCVREAHYVTTGPNGGVSHNFVSDYQCDQYEVMMLRYYVFKPMDNRVDYYTYSPITSQFEVDGSSQGSFPLMQKNP